MKALKDYILTEKLKLNKQSKINNGYHFYPKDKDELRSLLEKLLKERGKDADLNDIDVSAIQDFRYISPDKYVGLFLNLDIGNIDISKWDMSNATDISYMFYACKNFNSDLSHWNVSNVENMNFTFYDCEDFNCDLSYWNVKNVHYMNYIFIGCISLKNKPSWYKE